MPYQEFFFFNFVIVGTNGNQPQEERDKFGCNRSTIVDIRALLPKGVDIRSLLTKGGIFMDKKVASNYTYEISPYTPKP